MRAVKAACLAVLLAQPAVAQSGAGAGDPGAYDPGPIIDRAVDELAEMRALIDEMEEVGERDRWIGRSRSDVEADLDAHLDDLIAMIVGDTYAEARQRLLRADARIAEIEAELDQLRVDRLTARPSDEVMTRLDTVLMRDHAAGSLEDIEQRLERGADRLDELRRTRAGIERDFVRAMTSAYGIELTPEQARAILYQVNGRSIVEASIAFTVLQQVERRLGEIRTAVTSNDTLRRYYGVAAVMRLVSARLHELHLRDYREVWLPTLAEFEADNAALIDETRALISEAPDAATAARYRSNLEIQEEIAGVVDRYRDLLLGRQALVEERLAAAADDATLAVNTLRTLNQAVVLFDRFAWQQAEFEALMAIENEALIPLEGDDLEGFLDISRALAGS